MGIKDISVGRKDTFVVPLDKIEIEDGFNVRAETDELKAHIEFLSVSITENGYDPSKPLVGFIKDDKFVVRDGHCRFRAASLAVSRGLDLKGVPVVTEERTSNAADHLFGVFTRNTGKPLTSYEQAQVFKRLVSLQWEPKDIARKSGFSLVHVNNMLELAAAPQPVQEAVKDGEISGTLAVEVVKEHGPEAAATVIAEAVDVAKKAGKAKATRKTVDAVAPAPAAAGKSRKPKEVEVTAAPAPAPAAPTLRKRGKKANELSLDAAKILLTDLASALANFVGEMKEASRDEMVESAQNFVLIAKDSLSMLEGYGISGKDE